MTGANAVMPIQNDSSRPSRAEALSLGAIAVLAAAVLALSWKRWIEPIIDLGRDLYVPLAMVSGERLYADILYYYPPTTPAILAGIIAMFGSTIHVYVAIGILTALTAGAALYGIVRTTAGWPAGAAVLVAFVSLHMAGTSTWGANFIFPYAHAATFGMTFFLLHAAALTRHLFGTRSEWTGWSAAILGVVSASTKIEYIPAVGLVVLTAAIFYGFRWRYVIGMAAGGVGLVAALELIFSGAPAGHHWLRDNVLASQLLRSETAEDFYSRVSGTALLGDTGILMLRAALLVAAAAGLLVLAEKAARRGRRPVAAMMIAGALLAVVVLADGSFFRAWPMLVLALVPFALRERGSTPLAFLLALSVATAVRIFFSLGPWWYGFVLSLPTWALVAYAGARWLPDRGLYRRSFALVWLALVLLISGRGIADSVPRWRVRSFEVPTARGVFFDHPVSGAPLASLIEWLRQRDREETVTFIPEGLAVNWFAARRTPLSYYTFTPIEIADPTIEGRIVDQFANRPPDLVIFVPRDVREFGYRGFGIDYARDIMALLRRDYVPIWQWADPRFPILVLERARAPQEGD